MNQPELVLERLPIMDFDGVLNCRLATERVQHYVVFTGRLRIANSGSDTRPVGSVPQGPLGVLAELRRKAMRFAQRLANKLAW